MLGKKCLLFYNPRMISAATLVPCIAIVLCASLVQGAAAFGSALVAMPFLAMIMPARDAVALSLMMGVILNLMTIGDERRSIAWRQIAVLLPALAIGIGAGTLILKSIDGPAFKMLLSLVFLTMTLAMLASSSLKVKPGPVTAQAAGAISGLLTGSTSMGGPPLVLYLTGRGLAKSALKGTLAALFLLGNLFALASLLGAHVVAGGAAAVTLPLGAVMVPGYLAGRRLTSRLDSEVFRHLVLLVLALAALLEIGLSAAALV